MFQSTEPLYSTESFIKRVLTHGTSSESRALIEYDNGDDDDDDAFDNNRPYSLYML